MREIITRRISIVDLGLCRVIAGLVCWQRTKAKRSPPLTTGPSGGAPCSKWGWAQKGWAPGSSPSTALPPRSVSVRQLECKDCICYLRKGIELQQVCLLVLSLGAQHQVKSSPCQQCINSMISQDSLTSKRSKSSSSCLSLTRTRSEKEGRA